MMNKANQQGQDKHNRKDFMTNSTNMQALENNLQTDDSFKQKQALLKLLTSEDFAELQAISNNKFNIFQALKLQNNEVKHSNFLGWLLNPFESHYLMDCFFLRIAENCITK